MSLQRTLVSRSALPRFVPALLQRKESGTRFDHDWSLQFLCPPQRVTDIPVHVSPWHDIPLRPSNSSMVSSNSNSSQLDANIIHMVVEIPIHTREKHEVLTTQKHNPIRQDCNKKDNSLRLFQYGDIPFNYGCIPQTWENPNEVDEVLRKHDRGMKFLELRGDGDPLDAVLASTTSWPIGSLHQVRVLGVLAMIDQGEMDWKLLVADKRDTTFRRLQDVPRLFQKEVIDWFRYYKTAEGKPENEFALDGVFQGEDIALEVIAENARQYLRLMDGTVKNTQGLWLPSEVK